ncbi:hypothetical protein DICVIV_11600 [Dictyocaulus viviparus]|uniref:DUF2428 domain-containing protein n=1 Tax=Dictyocaulus viviparus TaxID=29172 RepID=A0A0D8XCR5_DICVI|nr:hypothetical protein DICVIV_11600 [Dictyocaulus viviparus]
MHLAAELSQLLLVCCWRAHKHVSLTLGWIVTELCPLNVLTTEDVHHIGAYYWRQLTECKHCGAFETSIKGYSLYSFSLCCVSICGIVKMLHFLDRSNGSMKFFMLLKEKKLFANCLYVDLSTCLCCFLFYYALLVEFCRGVPYLIATILATEPLNHPSQSLNIAMTSLLEMDQKSVRCRIHSLNVLKVLFSTAALGERVTPALEVGYVP